MGAISVKEAAERLGRTPQAIREAIERGDLVAEKRFNPDRPLLRPVYAIAGEEFDRYVVERERKRQVWSGRSTKSVVDAMHAQGYRTLAEAAEELRTSPGELRRLIRTGAIEAKREGVFFVHDDEIAKVARRRGVTR